MCIARQHTPHIGIAPGNNAVAIIHANKEMSQLNSIVSADFVFSRNRLWYFQTKDSFIK